MAAFIPRFAKDRSSSDHGADFRRDQWRNHGDRHPTGHGFHQHRQWAEVTAHAAPGAVFRQTAAATQAHRPPANGAAIVRDLVVFIFAAAIAVAGLITAIITPPI